MPRLAESQSRHRRGLDELENRNMLRQLPKGHTFLQTRGATLAESSSAAFGRETLQTRALHGRRPWLVLRLT